MSSSRPGVILDLQLDLGLLLLDVLLLLLDHELVLLEGALQLLVGLLLLQQVLAQALLLVGGIADLLVEGLVLALGLDGVHLALVLLARALGLDEALLHVGQAGLHCLVRGGALGERFLQPVQQLRLGGEGFGDLLDLALHLELAGEDVLQRPQLVVHGPCHSVLPLLVFQVVLQPAAARGMAQASQGLGLDLADAFPGDVKIEAHFLQSQAVPVLEAEAHLQHFLFAGREGLQHGFQLLL
jgi:hypothetical protein